MRMMWIAGVIAGVQALSVAVPAARAQDGDFRCRQTIGKEFAKFVRTTTGVVRKCNDAAVKSGAAASAPGGDIDGCDVAAKVSAGLLKMAGKIDAKCDGEGISPADILWPATCPDIEGGSCGNAIGAGSDIADCLDCAGRAAVAQTMDLYYLELADPAGDGDLVKCQRAVGKEAAKLLLTRQKILGKCRVAADKGKGTLPCPAPGDGKAVTAIAKAEAKFVAKLCKACGSESLDGTTCAGPGFAPATIGFAAECPAVTAPFGGPACGGPVTTLSDLVACVGCVTRHEVDCLDALSRPDQVGFPAECLSQTTATPTATASPTAPPPPTGTPTETPTDVPTATPTDTATPEPTATSTETPTSTDTPSPTATPTPGLQDLVFLEPVEPGTMRGGPGGTLAEDACPAGQALIGFAGNLDATDFWHRQIRGLCGTVQRVGAPGSWTIQIVPGETLPVRGNFVGISEYTRTCGPGEVVAGFGGRVGLYYDQLIVKCRPVLIDAEDGETITLGAPTTLAAVGGTTGSVFPQTDCSPWKVATGARIRWGDAIDALGLDCAQPAITVPPPTPTPCLGFQAKWGTLGSGAGQFNSPVSIARDTSDNLYVTDFSNNRIQKFDLAGTFLTQWGSSGSGTGNFSAPWGVAVDGVGDVYVTDQGNNRVQKFSPGGAFLATFGAAGSGNGQFNSPRGIAIDANGDIFIVDSLNNRVQKFDSAGAFLLQWGASGSGDGQFSTPRGIAVDAAGNVYVADSGNSRVQKFSGAGTFLGKWGALGTAEGLFQTPRGVTVDSGGNVYVVEGDTGTTTNNRVQKFTGSGTFLSKFGSRGTGDGQFRLPSGAAVDGAGNVYVADGDNDRIQKFGCP